MARPELHSLPFPSCLVKKLCFSVISPQKPLPAQGMHDRPGRSQREAYFGRNLLRYLSQQFVLGVGSDRQARDRFEDNLLSGRREHNFTGKLPSRTEGEKQVEQRKQEERRGSHDLPQSEPPGRQPTIDRQAKLPAGCLRFRRCDKGCLARCLAGAEALAHLPRRRDVRNLGPSVRIYLEGQCADAGQACGGGNLQGIQT